MKTFFRIISLVNLCILLAACAGGQNTIGSVVPAPLQNVNGSTTAIAHASSESVANTAPYRVHAFLEDTTGNGGCLYSGNYAAVASEADITEYGPSTFGRLPCPSSFNALRQSAGLKTYAYNDVVLVGNAMPISAISSNYYFQNSTCSAPFVQSGGSVNDGSAGRQITDLGHYPSQIAAQVNAWEATSGADYFFNDNFGNISVQGVPVADFCPSEWSVSNYVSGFPTFLNALAKPQIVNLAGKYDDIYTQSVAASNAFMISSEEGIPNFKRNANTSLANTESELDRLLELQKAGHRVLLIQYNPAAVDSSGNPIEFPVGFTTMYQQRIWNYAGGWLVLDHEHFYMETANEGNFTNSGATVEPEYHLVPQNPLVADPSGSEALLVGNVLVREFANCYYKSKPVGTCAMVLNPNASASTLPALKQTYAHSVVISGEGSMPALTGVGGGVSTPADTGTLSYAGPKITSVPAGSAVILIQ